MSSKLFVGGLSWDTNDQSLAAAFAPFGEVTEAKVISDRDTGRSRGFGFVTFVNEDDAADAIANMNDKELDGRTLNVSEDGLRLETGQFFEPGQQLRITLGLDNDLIQVTGQVVNSQPENEEICSSGVLFIELDGQDRETYRKHCETLKTSLGQ